MQTTRQLGKDGHIAKIINSQMEQMLAISIYQAVSISRLRNPIAGRLAAGWWEVVRGGERRYKTLHFPIAIVALQLLWSVM